jgi:glycosyltransferase involved in cell wall biosynthesis
MAAVPPDFIVFSDDWGEHPSSCQHLFRHIGRDHRVIWVNTIGMRDPKWSLGDLKKIWLKVSKMFRSAHTSSGTQGLEGRGTNIHVIQPIMLPYGGFAAVRAFNRWSVIRSVRALAARLGFKAPVVVSTVPNACDVVDAFGASTIVYYCVDDFSLWPGLNRSLVERMEDRLIAKADRLLATSLSLQRRLATTGRTVTLFTHGVDVELFSQNSGMPHPCLKDIPEPRVGYFGLFDERSDQALLAGLAATLPGVSFVFTGPLGVDVTGLQRLPNVYFSGPVPYAELPAIIAGLKVLMIPYRVDAFTDSISPLKLKEYLATGKAVVSTPLAEARLYASHLNIADGVEEWSAALRQALEPEKERREGREQALDGESWNAKADLLLALCRT